MDGFIMLDRFTYACIHLYQDVAKISWIHHTNKTQQPMNFELGRVQSMMNTDAV